MEQKKETPELRDADFSVLDCVEEKNGGDIDAKGATHQSVDAPSADDILLDPEALKVELQRLRVELEESKDKYMRALADSENFRKRTLKERSELLKYQGESIFLDMLSVADNLELALRHSDAEPQKLREGVELIYKLMSDTLGKWGIRSESAIGMEFDHTKHTAISKVEDNAASPGTVVNELRKTYFYKDRLLRPGEVVVAMSKSADSAESKTSEEQLLENVEENEEGRD